MTTLDVSEAAYRRGLAEGAARCLDLTRQAERAVVRLRLALGDEIPHRGIEGQYAIGTAARLDETVSRAVGAILDAGKVMPDGMEDWIPDPQCAMCGGAGYFVNRHEDGRKIARCRCATHTERKDGAT